MHELHLTSHCTRGVYVQHSPKRRFEGTPNKNVERQKKQKNTRIEPKVHFHTEEFDKYRECGVCRGKEEQRRKVSWF